MSVIPAAWRQPLLFAEVAVSNGCQHSDIKSLVDRNFSVAWWSPAASGRVSFFGRFGGCDLASCTLYITAHYSALCRFNFTRLDKLNKPTENPEICTNRNESLHNEDFLWFNLDFHVNSKRPTRISRKRQASFISESYANDTLLHHKRGTSRCLHWNLVTVAPPFSELGSGEITGAAGTEGISAPVQNAEWKIKQLSG